MTPGRLRGSVVVGLAAAAVGCSLTAVPAAPDAVAPDPAVSQRDLPLLRDAVTAYRRGDVAAGDAIRARVGSAGAGAFLDWTALRIGGVTVSFDRVMAFAVGYPDFPGQSWLRRRGEEALLVERKPAALVRTYFARERPQTPAGKARPRPGFPGGWSGRRGRDPGPGRLAQRHVRSRPGTPHPGRLQGHARHGRPQRPDAALPRPRELGRGPAGRHLCGGGFRHARSGAGRRRGARPQRPEACGFRPGSPEGRTPLSFRPDPAPAPLGQRRSRPRRFCPT